MYTPNIYTFNMIKTKKIKHILVDLKVEFDIENLQKKFLKWGSNYMYFEAYFDDDCV